MIDLPFLNGSWVSYEESMLHGKEINFDEDKTFGMSPTELEDDLEDL